MNGNPRSETLPDKIVRILLVLLSSYFSFFSPGSTSLPVHPWPRVSPALSGTGPSPIALRPR